MQDMKVWKELSEKLNKLHKRLCNLETFEATGSTVAGVHNITNPVDNTAILAGTTVFSNVVPGSYGTPSNAKGVWLSVRGESTVAGYLELDSADDVPTMFSSLVVFPAAGVYGSLCMVRLGTTLAGQFSIKAITANFSHVYASVVGYWY